MPKTKTKTRKKSQSPTAKLIVGAWFMHCDILIWGYITAETSEGIFHAALCSPDGKSDGTSRFFTVKDVPSLLFFRDREMWLGSVQAALSDGPCEAEDEPCDCEGCQEYYAEFKANIERRESAVQLDTIEAVMRSTIADDNSEPSAQVIAECKAELERGRKSGYTC
jgi:hypothetical protein